MVSDWCVAGLAHISQKSSLPTSSQIRFFLGSGCLAPSVKAIKTAQRSGVAEFVLIIDVWANQMIQPWVWSKRHEGPLFQLNAKTLNLQHNKLAGSVGFGAGELKPYTLRRGGASWHFTTLPGEHDTLRQVRAQGYTSRSQ